MTAAVAATAGHQPPPNSRISPARMNPRLATQATADPAEAVDADPDGHEIAPPPVLRRTHRGSLRPRADGRLVGLVSEADLLVKEGYPHGGEDAGLVDAVRCRRRLDKAAGTRAAD